MNEILFVDKPKGITSFDLCFKLRSVLKTKKIGHCGTLDPNATGVMIILSGNATKANQFLTAEDKEYIGTVKLGFETNTLDIEGNIIKEDYNYSFSKNALIEALNSFKGESVQIPPLTSAIKVNGKPLYKYQHEGKEIEIPKRNITIYEIELLDFNKDSFTFRCACSSGTYIRSLVRDVLAKLKALGTLIDLRRTRVGKVTINQCDKLDDVLKGNYHTHNLYDLLSYKYQTIQASNPTDIKNGKRIKLDSDEKEVLFVDGDKLLAIYEKDGEFYRSKRGLF